MGMKTVVDLNIVLDFQVFVRFQLARCANSSNMLTHLRRMNVYSSDPRYKKKSQTGFFPAIECPLRKENTTLLPIGKFPLEASRTSRLN